MLLGNRQFDDDYDMDETFFILKNMGSIEKN